MPMVATTDSGGKSPLGMQFITRRHICAPAIRLMGWWPQYERWQQALVDLIDEEARTSGRPPVPLWDFGGYSSITTDPVQAFPDGTYGYRWYADAIHFSTEVGYMCLDRVLGVTPAPGLPDDFGVRLTRESLAVHQSGVREAQVRYVSSHADDAAALAGVPADAPPTTSITGPPSPQAQTTFTITGSAADDIGVNGVSLTLRDTQNRYLQDDGTVSFTYNSFQITPDVVGATSTTWSYEVTVPFEIGRAHV